VQLAVRLAVHASVQLAAQLALQLALHLALQLRERQRSAIPSDLRELPRMSRLSQLPVPFLVVFLFPAGCLLVVFSRLRWTVL
jgi:hypothetical protein